MSDDVWRFGQHFSRVLDARDRAHQGQYCACTEPDRLGSMCQRCGFLDRDFEVEQVVAICQAHDFQPDVKHPEMCGVCSNWEPHRRHHGTSDIGFLRDGTEIDSGRYPQGPSSSRAVRTTS